MQVIDVVGSLNDKLFALVYGGSGSGKTHFVGTLGELGKVLVIDVDKGSKTLASAADLKGFGQNITVVSFDKFKDLDTAYKHIDKNDPAMWNKLFETPDLIKEPFDWIVWDTWSELQWAMMSELRKNESIAGTGLNFRKNVQIQHWGMLTDLNKLAIEQLRDCNVNQMFTMQEVIVKDEISGITTGGPAIHGKMVQEVPTYFDVVIRTSTDAMGNYVATTKRKGFWPAKSRLKAGMDYKNPTAKNILVV